MLEVLGQPIKLTHFFIFYFFNSFLLEYSLLIDKLCQFLLYNKMNQILFPYRSLRRIEQSSPGSTVGSYQLPVLYIIVCGLTSLDCLQSLLWLEGSPSLIGRRPAWLHWLHLNLDLNLKGIITFLVFKEHKTHPEHIL